MDIEEFLEIGLPIEIEVPIYDKTHGKNFYDIYFSQLTDFDSGTISVSMPQRQGKIPIMYQGDTVYLRVTTDEAIYSCSCKMLDWIKRPEGIKLSHPFQVNRIQRRNYVRVDAELPIEITFQKEVGEDLFEETIKALTSDVSGGGLLVYIDQFIPLFTEIDIKLTIPAEEDSKEPDTIIEIPAQICRSSQIRRNLYQVGISFYQDISENDRDTIVKFIFRRMRELIQTRLPMDDE